MKLENKQGKGWIAILFGLIFLTGGLSFLFFTVLPDVYDGWRMQSWQPTQAKLLTTDLDRNTSGDTDTFKASARYEYTLEGQRYTSTRVAIADNIGDFQETLARKLRTDFLNHQPITIWYNPQNPASSIINRDIRWGLIAFKMIFVIALILTHRKYCLRESKRSRRNHCCHCSKRVRVKCCTTPILRNPWNSTAGVLFGGIFAAVGVFLWQQAKTEGGMLYFMASVFGLIGFAVVLAGIYSAFNALQIKLDGTSLHYRRRFLIFTLTDKMIPYTDITRIDSRRSSASNTSGKHRIAYKVFALARGKKYTLAESVTSVSKRDLVVAYFENEMTH